MTDHAQDSHAIAAITRILTNAAPTDAPEVTAAHILAALHGHGWRPTQAQPPPPWQPTSQPAPPTDDYRQARAIIAGRTDL